jgi:oxygen-dependent protoporphyrinogen oxidase
MKRVVIIGAGISGLTTAFHIGRIARARGVAVRVMVLGSDSRPGGRVWTERADGFQIELGASSFQDTKRSTLELCCDLDLIPDLISARPEARDRFIFWRDRLHKLPTAPGGLLWSRLLSWRGKLRLLREVFVGARNDGAEESIHEFACRRIGREAAEILVDAMVTGIHAGDPNLLSVAAAFPRMIELEREYGSLIRAMPKVRRRRSAEAAAARDLPAAADAADRRNMPAPTAGPGGTLWSLKRGMGELIERLVDACGAEVCRGVAVRQIVARGDSGWTVRGDGTDTWQADAVVLACPSFAQAMIVESLSPSLAELLAAIRHNSIASVALGFREAELGGPPRGLGYLSPQRTRRDVLGVLWSSTIFADRAPPGMVLLEARCGGWNRPDIVGWDDERLVRAVRDELRFTMGIGAVPSLVRVTRWPQAIPQYHLGHLERVAEIERQRRQFRGLYLTGNSFRGVSVNDCTEDAARCAAEVVHDLATSTS